MNLSLQQRLDAAERVITALISAATAAGVDDIRSRAMAAFIDANPSGWADDACGRYLSDGPGEDAV